jgi:hypothetical protein
LKYNGATLALEAVPAGGWISGCRVRKTSGGTVFGLGAQVAQGPSRASSPTFLKTDGTGTWTSIQANAGNDTASVGIISPTLAYIGGNRGFLYK